MKKISVDEKNYWTVPSLFVNTNKKCYMICKNIYAIKTVFVFMIFENCQSILFTLLENIKHFLVFVVSVLFYIIV